MLNQLCNLTAKNAPYPPRTPAAHCARAGRGVTAFWLKIKPDSTRMLSRVTQTPFIAGPLGGIDNTSYYLLFCSFSILTIFPAEGISTGISSLSRQSNFTLQSPFASIEKYNSRSQKGLGPITLNSRKKCNPL